MLYVTSGSECTLIVGIIATGGGGGEEETYPRGCSAMMWSSLQKDHIGTFTWIPSKANNVISPSATSCSELLARLNRDSDDVRRGMGTLHGSLASTSNFKEKKKELYLLAVGYLRCKCFTKSADIVDKCLEILREPGSGGSSTSSIVCAVKKWQKSDPQNSKDR
nr:mitochondrial fission 1 protein A-like [Tanacetum cinerariifolium]